MTQRRQKPTERTDPRARIAALALLDRAFASTSDDELRALAAGATEDQRREIGNLAGTAPDADDLPAAVRAAAQKGRMNGTAEALAALLVDHVLADCIEQLGDKADLPANEDLQAIAPGLVERHGLGGTRLMFASVVCGEAPASAVLVDILRHDETLKLPPAEPLRVTPVRTAAAPSAEELAERERVKAARAERKEREKQAAAARRAQAQAARRR